MLDGHFGTVFNPLFGELVLESGLCLTFPYNAADDQNEEKQQDAEDHDHEKATCRLKHTPAIVMLSLPLQQTTVVKIKKDRIL